MAAKTKMYPPFLQIKAFYTYSSDLSVLVHKDLSAYFYSSITFHRIDIPHLIYPVDEH